MATELVTQLTNENFEEEVGSFAGTVLVDFWAPWCGPCRMVAPIVEELAKEYQGKAKIAKLNTDEAPDIAGRYGIRSIPTMLFFKNGQVVQTLVGAYPKTKIAEKLLGVLA
jgi:thioredoxin 1